MENKLSREQLRILAMVATRQSDELTRIWLDNGYDTCPIWALSSSGYMERIEVIFDGTRRFELTEEGWKVLKEYNDEEITPNSPDAL